MTSNPDFAPVEDAPVERAAATVEQLEQEGDIAADFLEELLDIADIDGDLALDVRSGRAYVSVEAAEGGSLALLVAIPTPCRRCRSSPASRCRTAPADSHV